MDPAPATRERTLRAAALVGDEPAWAELFRAAYETVFRYALWRCGGRTDLAEDVVQDVWLLAARKLRGFDPDRGSFAAWVCGLAANMARNAVRSRLRHARRLAAVRVPESGPSDDDPEVVAVALAELPAEYEAVLRAKYFDQRSVSDIAGELGKGMKAVESLLTLPATPSAPPTAAWGEPTVSEPPDPLAVVFPASPDSSRRERTLAASALTLRRGRWVRRGWAMVLAVGLFVAGGVSGWMLKPTPPAVVVVASVSPEPPPPASAPVPSPPVEPEPLTAEQLELRAELADDPADAARLFREAGDRFLKGRDFENATRCYRRHLSAADSEGRRASTSDSWLLMTLKLPAR